jgi:sodium/hydrogen antiporter
MNQLNIALAVIGALVVIVGLFTKPIKKSPIQEPILAMLLGVALGPYGLRWLDVAAWGEENRVLEEASRLTLAIGLMGVALRLRPRSITGLLRPLAVLLTLGLLGSWLVSSALAGVVLGLPLWTALLIGSVVTPTDPVVASSIVTGPFSQEKLPLRVRDGLSYESGANDGLAYLIVMLPLLIMSHGEQGWSRWLSHSLVVGVLLASALGFVIGYGAARLLKWAERKKTVENTSLLGYTLAFSLFTLGMASLLKADALISVFLAGLIFNLHTDRHEEHEEEHVQEAVARLFTLPMFVIFGIALPFSQWAEVGWPLAVLAVLVLLLRRVPVVLGLFPLLRRHFNFCDTAYIGWFGPIGIAAIFYATHARSHSHDPQIWTIASALVFASILAHGATAPWLTIMYEKQRCPPPPEDIGKEDVSDEEDQP